MEAAALPVSGARPRSVGPDGVAVRHEDRPFDGVGELTDVAGPLVSLQRAQGGLVETDQRFAVLLGEAAEEVVGEEWDVFRPIAQRRQPDLHRVEPEEEVFPESPGRRLGPEIGVGRGQDPDIDRRCLGTAHPFELAGLQGAQKLGLLIEGDVGDLVEKQGRAVGHLEPSDPFALGVGERALDVAEELAGEDAFGEPADVDGDQRPVGSGRDRVQRASPPLPCPSRARR